LKKQKAKIKILFTYLLKLEFVPIQILREGYHFYVRFCTFLFATFPTFLFYHLQGMHFWIFRTLFRQQAGVRLRVALNFNQCFS